MRIADLPNIRSALVDPPGSYLCLYCAVCQSEFSAHRGDYFTHAPDGEITCCGRPVQLMRRESRVVPLRTSSTRCPRTEERSDHSGMLPTDVRRRPFWADDETVKELRRAAVETGVTAYIEIMLTSSATMGDGDLEALCAVADILGLKDAGDDAEGS